MGNLIINTSDLGAAIRARRKALKLGQQELANRVGVTRQWILEIEHGKPGAGVGPILHVLDALGLNVSLDERVSAPANTNPTLDIDAIIQSAKAKR